MMTPGQGETLSKSSHTSGTYRPRVHCGATSYNRPSPSERGQGRGILQGHGYEGSHREPLPWKIHRRQEGQGHIAVREGAALGRVGEDTVGGRLQAPAVRLRRTEEVTPTGVVICAEVHS